MLGDGFWGVRAKHQRQAPAPTRSLQGKARGGTQEISPRLGAEGGWGRAGWRVRPIALHARCREVLGRKPFKEPDEQDAPFSGSGTLGR